MPYIKNVNHFVNYLRRSLRDYPVADIYNANTYIELIYNAGLADNYCWDLRHDPTLIGKSALLNWLKNQSAATRLSDITFSSQMTQQFIETVEDLYGLPGVYSFWAKEDTVLYVGMSANLGNRIPTSFERFRNIDEEIYLSHIRTESVSDAALLEVYYITTLKPPLNTLARFPDTLTLVIQNPPSFDNLILCNTVSKQAS